MDVWVPLVVQWRSRIVFTQRPVDVEGLVCIDRIVPQFGILHDKVRHVNAKAIHTRSSQKRATSNMAPLTAGLRQFRSGCSLRKECR